jgi:hypothetical protein
MSTQYQSIGWGRYKDFTGPFTRGTVPYTLPENPTQGDKILAVATSTEGGRWNAVNMYDSCIYTVGLIQWCEGGQFSVSELLGAIGRTNSKLLEPMNELLKEANASFNFGSRKPRFYMDGDVVDTREEQRRLFLLRSNGKKNSWDDESVVYAKRWAAAAVDIFADEEAIRIQKLFTLNRRMGFVAKEVRTIVDMAPVTNVGQAFVAAYLSYAGNNPSWARDAIIRAVADNAGKRPAYTLDWLVHVLGYLTHNRSIAIYPHRYNAIRKVLEKLYEIDLPDTADLLGRPLSDFISPEDVQKALVFAGFDIGPSGVDGVVGKKTKEALIDFKRVLGLELNDNINESTQAALKAVLEFVEHSGSPVEAWPRTKRALMFAEAMRAADGDQPAP